MKTGDCCALFLSSSSPGRVLRFIERRCATTSAARAALLPFELRLSDPVGEGHLRALVGTADARSWFRETAPLFVPLFGPVITLLYVSADLWGYQQWQTDIQPEEGEIGTEEAVPPAVAHPLTRFWHKPDTPLSRATAWGLSHNLPVNRVPALSRDRIPVIDYVTIAVLDQRSLLVESGPKLYRLFSA